MWHSTVALLVWGTILLHAAALGGTFVRISGLRFCDGWTRLAVLGGVGLALFGLELFIVGEIRVLTRTTLLMSTAVTAALMLWNCSGGRLADSFAMPRRKAAGGSRRFDGAGPRGDRVTALWVALGIVFSLLVIASWRPPTDIDEVDYHWPAPLLWASAGGWVQSPYRLTNGPALAEMLFTVSAVCDNSTAAHLTGVLAVALIAAACGSLAKSVGVGALPAAAAAMSVSALICNGPEALNDKLAAAFALCAYAAMFGEQEASDSAWPRTLTTALLVSAAISTKPFTLLCVPGLCAYLLRRSMRSARAAGGEGDRSISRRSAIAGAAVLCAASAVTLGVWSAHCYAHTGKLWDNNGYAMASNSSDPLWDNPKAAGRAPRLQDFVTMPIILPVAATLGHESNVYGNRIGPLLLVFGLAGIAGARQLRPEHRFKLSWLLASAAFYLVVFCPISPKTRFHIFVWGIAAVLAAVGWEWTQTRRPTTAQLARYLFLLLLAIGVADASRHLFSFGLQLGRRVRGF